MTLKFELLGPDFNLPSDIKAILKKMGTKRYTVTMTPMYMKRTYKQNAYFHLLVGKICMHSGGSQEEVKAYIKRSAMDLGYPPKMNEGGEPEMDEDNEYIPMPSHMANSREMGLLIDAATYIAGDLGIPIDPDDAKKMTN